MKRVIRIVLLAFISITTLSSCLVEKKDLTKITSKTDNLRVYQVGDTISYNVTADTFQNSGGGFVRQNGTLTVNWLSPIPLLIRPGTTDPIVGAIKEVTTLNLDGSETATVRYISQNIDGQITLHAIEDTGGERYWLNSDSNPVQGSDTLSYVIFESNPYPLGIEYGDMGPITFNVMGGCSSDTICDEPAAVYTDDTFDVVGNTEVTTNMGVFVNPFHISFSGGSVSTNGTLTIPVIIDIRDACGTDGPVIHGTGVGTGTMYVLPEIGMIKMDNTCVTSGGAGITVYYTISIRSTNIPLP